jgi:hypothetical protein
MRLAILLAALSVCAPFVFTAVGAYRFEILFIAFLLLLTGIIFRPAQAPAQIFGNDLLPRSPLSPPHEGPSFYQGSIAASYKPSKWTPSHYR